MKNNIIALYAGGVPAVREVDDPELYVNFVEHHAGHIQRRKDRKDARRRAIRRAEEDRDQQLRDFATAAMFSTLFGVLAVGLAL